MRNSLPAKEPWKLTKEEVILGMDPRFKYGGDMGETIARVEPNGKIMLSDGFFEHQEKERRDIIRHEFAHSKTATSKIGAEAFWRIVDSNLFGKYNEAEEKWEVARGFSGRNVEEAITQAVADYEEDPVAFQQKHPRQTPIIRAISAGLPFSNPNDIVCRYCHGFVYKDMAYAVGGGYRRKLTYHLNCVYNHLYPKALSESRKSYHIGLFDKYSEVEQKIQDFANYKVVFRIILMYKLFNESASTGWVESRKRFEEMDKRIRQNPINLKDYMDFQYEGDTIFFVYKGGLAGLEQLDGTIDRKRHTANINMIEVTKERQGYGRKYLQMLEDMLKTYGVKKITGVADPFVIDFWGSMGYTRRTGRGWKDWEGFNHPFFKKLSNPQKYKVVKAFADQATAEKAKDWSWARIVRLAKTYNVKIAPDIIGRGLNPHPDGNRPVILPYSVSGTALVGNPANYKAVYRDLVKVARNQGIKVRQVPHSVLKDFWGMNWLLAKQIGYKIPAYTVHIRETLNDKNKAETLNHELIEVSKMRKGNKYWSSHLKALAGEKSFLASDSK